MLRIEKPNNILFEGKNIMQEVPASQVGDFLLSCISESVTLGDDITLGDLMEVSAHLKDFIKSYFLEEYQALNAIVSSDYMVKPISDLVIYQELIISPSGELMICSKIRTENKRPITSYHDVKVSYDPMLVVVDELSVLSQDKQTLQCPLGFLTLLGAIFEEFQDYITVNLS